MTGIGSQLSNSSCQILRAYSNFQAHIRMYIRISDCIANSYTDHYDNYRTITRINTAYKSTTYMYAILIPISKLKQSNINKENKYILNCSTCDYTVDI